jgi:hypothetical protein
MLDAFGVPFVAEVLNAAIRKGIRCEGPYLPGALLSGMGSTIELFSCRNGNGFPANVHDFIRSHHVVAVM